MTSTRRRERPVILFMHTTDVSARFVRGQLEHLERLGFECHYAAAFDGLPSSLGGWPRTWSLPLARQPSPVSDLRALVATIRLMRRLAPDAVHAGTPKAGLIGMISARVRRVPVRIYAVHGLRYETSSGIKRRVFILAERLAARCASAVVADSDTVRDLLVRDIRVPPAKVRVLGPGSSNGVDLDRFSPAASSSAARQTIGIDERSTVVGFVGRLTRDKGIDDLVAAHAHLREVLDVVLLLVGTYEDDDPVSPSTRSSIERDPSIIHLHWTDVPETAYQAMDLLVFPSYREGLPNVPLEAQACGVPVVAYAATGTRDAVADHGLLVPVGDVDQLTSTVLEALSDHERLARYGEAARQWVGRFDRHLVWNARAAFLQSQVRCSGSPRRPGPAGRLPVLPEGGESTAEGT